MKDFSPYRGFGDAGEFGRGLKRTRMSHLGMRQKELAEMVGVHPSWISQYERGDRLPSLPMLVRLCNALGVDADIIIRNGCDRSTKRKEKKA